MSRVIELLVISLLAATLACCAKPAGNNSEDAGSEDAGDDDAGEEVGICEPPSPTSPAWMEQVSAATEHVIDGLFGSGDWDGVIPLEGVFTDLYLDYQAPYLYALNDWRANKEGISPDCYNEFGVNVGSTRVVVRVFGDGHMTVGGAELDGEGAYAFSASPRWNSPHTIYEFRLTMPGTGPVCVRLKDPTNYSNCEDLASEPVVFAISTGTLSTRVARVPDDDVAELGAGEACGNGEGICGEELSCVEEGGSTTCMEVSPPDPDDDGRDASSDVTTDIPEDVDFPEEPPP